MKAMAMQLIHFSRARQELALATRVDEVKEIRDKAEALRAYAKQAGESLEMQNRCAEIKIRAERRGGEILKEQVRPGNPQLLHGVTIRKLPEEISRIQSHRWQLMASLPRAVRDELYAKVQAAGGELHSAAVLRLAKTALDRH